MQIRFFPMRSNAPLSLVRAGDTLTINGTSFDFSQLEEGETLPKGAVASGWLAADVTRTGGQLQVALILPLGTDASDTARFPLPLELTEDGPVSLPGGSEA